MVRSLGEQFRDIAVGPIAQSESCLAVGRLDEALSHLSRAKMMGAVRDGVEKVAGLAGVAPLSVFKLLPMARLDSLMGGVEGARTNAAANASEVLLTSSVDDRDLEVAVSLRRIAGRRPAGDELAAALTTVADDMDQWHLAVEECCVLIDGSRDIGSAYRRRQMRRFALYAALALVVGAGGAWAARWQQASSQVRAALATGDPCASEQIDAKDLKHVGGGLAAEVDSARQRCSEQREQQQVEQERERAQQEDQRRIEEKQRLEQARLAEHRKACQRLSDHLRDNALDEADEKLAGSHAELLRRVAGGTIEPPDVARDVSALPCADTISLACASALVASWNNWLLKETPSPSMLKLVADAKPKLDDVTRARLRRRVRQQADGARLSGKPQRLAHSAVLCALLGALEIELPTSCAAQLKTR
jgi:hypothetical protein